MDPVAPGEELDAERPAPPAPTIRLPEGGVTCAECPDPALCQAEGECPEGFPC